MSDPRDDWARRPRLVIGNWKMNPASLSAAVELARAVAGRTPATGVRVGVAAPALFVPAVAEALHGTSVAVYAQDVSAEEKGAYTGQIAAPMLTALVTGTLVGHSEARRYLGDDDARVAKKLVQAMSAGLEVVLCVGEREDEFDAGATEDVLAAQLGPPLRALSAADRDGRMSERFVIAYEPVWAIGTGKASSGENANDVHGKVIRPALSDLFGSDGAQAMRVLYGGSVTAANAPEFFSQSDIDGALVGGASLKPEEFVAITKAAQHHSR